MLLALILPTSFFQVRIFIAGPTYHRHCFLVGSSIFRWTWFYLTVYNYHNKNICLKFNYDSLLYIFISFTYLVHLCSVEKWNKVELNWIWILYFNLCIYRYIELLYAYARTSQIYIFLMKQNASLNVGVNDLWFIKIFQIDVK